MHVLILGGGGFLGAKLGRALAAKGEIGGAEISLLTTADLKAPEVFAAPFPVIAVPADISDPAACIPLLAEADMVFHLAAVVSGQAEAEFETGMRVNLIGSLNVLEAGTGSRGGSRGLCSAPRWRPSAALTRT